MKKLLSVMFLASSAYAEPVTINKPIVCDAAEIVFKTLSGENYQERPIWLATSTEKLVNYSLWVNASSKTWTIVQFNKDIACILGVGESYTTIGKKPIL
jgi:hypothetical protein